jgi:hypothetical protein
MPHVCVRCQLPGAHLRLAAAPQRGLRCPPSLGHSSLGVLLGPVSEEGADAEGADASPPPGAAGGGSPGGGSPAAALSALLRSGSGLSAAAAAVLRGRATSPNPAEAVTPPGLLASPSSPLGGLARRGGPARAPSSTRQSLERLLGEMGGARSSAASSALRGAAMPSPRATAGPPPVFDLTPEASGSAVAAVHGEGVRGGSVAGELPSSLGAPAGLTDTAARSAAASPAAGAASGGSTVPVAAAFGTFPSPDLASASAQAADVAKSTAPPRVRPLVAARATHSSGGGSPMVSPRVALEERTLSRAVRPVADALLLSPVWPDGARLSQGGAGASAGGGASQGGGVDTFGVPRSHVALPSMGGSASARASLATGPSRSLPLLQSLAQGPAQGLAARPSSFQFSRLASPRTTLGSGGGGATGVLAEQGGAQAGGLTSRASLLGPSGQPSTDFSLTQLARRASTDAPPAAGVTLPLNPVAREVSLGGAGGMRMEQAALLASGVGARAVPAASGVSGVGARAPVPAAQVPVRTSVGGAGASSGGAGERHGSTLAERLAAMDDALRAIGA